MEGVLIVRHETVIAERYRSGARGSAAEKKGEAKVRQLRVCAGNIVLHKDAATCCQGGADLGGEKGEEKKLLLRRNRSPVFLFRTAHKQEDAIGSRDEKENTSR